MHSLATIDNTRCKDVSHKQSVSLPTATSGFMSPHSQAPTRQPIGAQAPHPAPATTATGAGRSPVRSGLKRAPQRRQLPIEEQGPSGAPARPRTYSSARTQQPRCVREAHCK